MDDVGAAAVELAAELVAIDSVNPGLVPGAAGEPEILARLKKRLDRAGFDTAVVDAASRPNRPSLLAVPPGPADRVTVVLNGHLDTVGVAGMPEAFTPRIEGGRLIGRGAADMKGGVAAMVVAAERLAADPAVRPVLALVADEEDASVGSEAVLAALPELGVQPDVCLIGEPTDLAIARSLRGFALVRVRFRGRAAHSSQRALGVNAITGLGRLLAAVEARAPEVLAAGGDLMVTVVRGGTSAFVIPDSAECLVESRFRDPVSPDDAFGTVSALLDSEFGATAELLAGREAWRMDADGPAPALAARLADQFGPSSPLDAPYWMEAPLWQARCPTLICGPSGGGLHAVDEWVDLGQLRSYATALVAALPAWAEAHRTRSH